ncbi:hypothetical protein [Polyangium sorediatum]|uniref:Response regulatory domain-containing protein n=1 Tax=Polyangium sorediatum TaxID=889274 RepID=A0ABT6NZL7_9BACT|nr:hypothetical protein [Polyangium sorediatum]MDI1433791.1 hypothetical protein [Polyangium sorediatum]
MIDARTDVGPRSRRILVARDPRLSTCDALVQGLEPLIEDVELVEAYSVEAARSWAKGGPFDLCLVCLDLPPAPRGGARLAKELMRRGQQVVLITRSLRWLPAEDLELRSLPWIVPEADPTSVLVFLKKEAAPVASPSRTRAKTLPPMTERERPAANET